MAAVAHTHAYGIAHSISRLAEARIAARRAEAAAASTTSGDARAAARPRLLEVPHPKLFKMDVSTSTGVHTGVPWGAISLGTDHCVARLDNPAYEGFAAAFFFDPAKIKAEQGPITNGWMVPRAVRYQVQHDGHATRHLASRAGQHAHVGRVQRRSYDRRGRRRIGSLSFLNGPARHWRGVPCLLRRSCQLPAPT